MDDLNLDGGGELEYGAVIPDTFRSYNPDHGVKTWWAGSQRKEDKPADSPKPVFIF